MSWAHQADQIFEVLAKMTYMNTIKENPQFRLGLQETALIRYREQAQKDAYNHLTFFAAND